MYTYCFATRFSPFIACLLLRNCGIETSALLQQAVEIIKRDLDHREDGSCVYLADCRPATGVVTVVFVYSIHQCCIQKITDARSMVSRQQDGQLWMSRRQAEPSWIPALFVGSRRPMMLVDLRSDMF